VDTIKQLDNAALTRLLNDVDEGPNTHLSRVGFSIENQQHITIVFRNDSSPANALYLPWTVRIEDPITSMYAMPITRFIREICPLLFSETDRVKVLHSFVRGLYK